MARKSRKGPHSKDSVVTDKAVGYVRISLANKESSDSVENQKRIIEDWAAQHELPVSEFYIDSGYSGEDFDRPAFTKMIKDIESGLISCIAVKDLSRLGRDFLSTSYYVEEVFPLKKSDLCP